MNMLLKTIGYIRSEHTKAECTPIQPVYADECIGSVEIFPGFEEGLRDIEGFSHIILLYWLHEAKGHEMPVKPFLVDTLHGVFATRSPRRPNPIGLSIVQLTERKGPVLSIRGVDVLDNTPLLDIKPYSSRFDCFLDTRNGWQETVSEADAIRRGKRSR